MWRWHMTGDAVISPRDYERALEAIDDQVIQVRLLKPQDRIVDSANMFRECYEAILKLKLDIKPPPGVMPIGLAFKASALIIAAVIGAVVAVILF